MRWRGHIFLAALALAGPVLADERAALAQAWADLRMGNWSQAADALPALAASASEDIACQARYCEGTLWEFRRPTADIERARAAYRWIIQQHPRHPLTPWAALALARIPDLDVLQPAPRASVKLYRQVRDAYPASDAAQEAALHLAEALFAADGKAGAQQAVTELVEWMARHPSPKYAAQMELMLGRLCRYPLEDFRQAVTHAARALDLGLATPTQRSRTCWMIAETADRDLHDRDLAVTYYTRFLKDYPRDASRFRAKLALERLGAPVPLLDDMSLSGAEANQ